MERLQGPINHSCQFFGEHFDHHQVADQSLEEHGLARFEEELEDKMPFLQMLQSVHETPSFWPLNKEPSFRTLLKLQHLKRSPWELGVTTNYYNNNTYHYMNNNMYHEIMEAQIQALDFESCVTTPPPPTTTTHDIVVDYNDHQLLPQQDQRQQLQCPEEDLTPIMKETQKGKPSEATKERRKRKRARPAKNKEEVESQRMTHIAVERNRRRQMNDHLNVLRSLMPSSYIRRGDQASIVGGAIDFVKELEQLLQSLEAQKRMRITTTHEISNNSLTSFSSSSSSSSSSSVTSTSSNGLLTSSLPRFRAGRDDEEKKKKKSKTSVVIGEEVRAENKSECADIEATVIQTHVNLKVQCPKRPGQLLKAIVALEDLRLTVLHLSITSSDDTILYSFNLKIADGCQLGSADEIAGAVHRIFRIIDQS